MRRCQSESSESASIEASNLGTSTSPPEPGCYRRHLSHGERPGQRLRIRVGEPGRGSHEGLAAPIVIGEIGADQRRAHGGPVASRPDAGAIWRPAEPELEHGPQRGEADSRRKPQEPEAQAAGELALELLRIARVSEERLGYEEGVLGIVAQHPAAQRESVSPAAAE